MDASVIICSRNRRESLLETLKTLFAMEVPGGISFEVLVVDNASTDGTADAVRAAVWTRGPRLVVLNEPQPGKSHALNRALEAAKGEVLLFTDDDALVDAGWLDAMLRAFAVSNADCVGGRVIPHWLVARPAWLSDRFLNTLAMLDLGPKSRDLTTELLYGVNFAFRREVFASLGAFDTRLCARGCGNEDREMIERLRAAGGRVYYDPAISVHHKVFPERVTQAYFRRWYRLNGRDRAELPTDGRRTVFGLEPYMVRSAGRSLARFAAATLRGDAEERFYQELQLQLYCAYGRARLARRSASGAASPSSGRPEYQPKNAREGPVS